MQEEYQLLLSLYAELGRAAEGAGGVSTLAPFVEFDAGATAEEGGGSSEVGVKVDGPVKARVSSEVSLEVEVVGEVVGPSPRF